jgi:hypothetical protein
MIFDFTDVKTLFALVGLLSNMAFLPYFIDLFKKRTKPHIYTWFIWLITQGTATLAALEGGAGLGVLGLAVGMVFVTAVFVLSFWYGTKNITRSDTVALIAALAAIIVWWWLQEPVLAVLLVALIDGLGYIPTFRKSFSAPWSETALSWGIFAVGNVASLLALEAYSLLTVPYLAMIAVANTSLALFLLARRKRVPKPA